MASEFAAGKDKISSPEIDLPHLRIKRPREQNQGMNKAMTNLTGTALSANGYVQWFHHLTAPQIGYEWCHLVAHSMGGAGGPTNIVAGRASNNTEQLIIENMLSMYRSEKAIKIKVKALVEGNNRGIYLGNIIRYRVYIDGNTKDFFLDCRVNVAPSGIHLLTLAHEGAQWINKMLADRADRAGCAVTWNEHVKIRRFLMEKLQAPLDDAGIGYG